MADEKYTFETARVRLEEIAAEVRKKDTSLEKSLDLLEEGVRLANICTELVDHTDMTVTTAPVSGEADGADQPDGLSGVDVAGVADTDEAAAGDDVPGQGPEPTDHGDGAVATDDAPRQDVPAE